MCYRRRLRCGLRCRLRCRGGLGRCLVRCRRFLVSRCGLRCWLRCRGGLGCRFRRRFSFGLPFGFRSSRRFGSRRSAFRLRGFRRADRTRGVLGPDHTGAGERARLRGRRDRRFAVIRTQAQGRIGARSGFLLALRGGWWSMRLVRGRLLRRGRLGPDAASSAVIADVIHRGVVNDGLVVDVGDMHAGVGDIVDGGVVEKVPALPIAAFIARAAVAEAVIDAAVEPDVRSPVAGVEHVCTAGKAPVAGRPKEPWLRNRHPGSGHPVIIPKVIAIGPVTRCPHVPVLRDRRLLVHRQLRGRHIDRNTNTDLRHRSERHRRQQDK